MASHLPLNRITGTARFFRAVLAVRKQLATADRLMGYTLRAHVLARDWQLKSGYSASFGCGANPPAELLPAVTVRTACAGSAETIMYLFEYEAVFEPVLTRFGRCGPT